MRALRRGPMIASRPSSSASPTRTTTLAALSPRRQPSTRRTTFARRAQYARLSASPAGTERTIAGTSTRPALPFQGLCRPPVGPPAGCPLLSTPDHWFGDIRYRTKGIPGAPRLGVWAGRGRGAPVPKMLVTTRQEIIESFVLRNEALARFAVDRTSDGQHRL